MTNGITIFAIAVGGTALICYVLATQSKYRRGNRRSSPDSFAPDTNIFGVGDGSHFHGSDNHHFLSDPSSNSGDSSSSGDPGGDASGAGGGGDGGGGSSD